MQNNWVTDFNAAVKVNGKDGRYPDAGIIRRNLFTNNQPRKTDRPITVLDIVSVSRWRVQRNIIADFAKDGGNFTRSEEHTSELQSIMRISYAVLLLTKKKKK